jgi:hypothetical protein
MFIHFGRARSNEPTEPTKYCFVLSLLVESRCFCSQLKLTCIVKVIGIVSVEIYNQMFVHFVGARANELIGPTN